MVGLQRIPAVIVGTFLLEPDLFATYIAFDPSLWWNNPKLVNNAAECLRANPKLDKTLYFASSGEDIAEITQRFADVLVKNAASGVR